MASRSRALTGTAMVAALLLAGCGGAETEGAGSAPGSEPAPGTSEAATPEAPAPGTPDTPDTPDTPGTPDTAEPDAGPGAGTGAESDPAAPSPTPLPAPTPAPDPSDTLPPIARINPDLGWPWDEDLERLAAFPGLVDAAFDEGAREGLRFLAEHSWPDGYTTEAMLACRTSEPTPTYAELDAEGWRYRVDFLPGTPVPGFQYPPTGEYPVDFGLRGYAGLLTVITEVDGEPVNTFEDIARLAVRPDGTVAMFPTCFPFLPGQYLEHRVTDGDVGGYTDAEAEGDIRVIFAGSPPEAQAQVCERLAAGAIDDLFLMIVPPDIEFTEATIPRPVMERTVTELCEARLR